MIKRRYKVLASVPKADGTGDWLMRVGSGADNKDASINVYVDAIPLGAFTKGMKLQIRELEESDLRPRDTNRAIEPRAGDGTPRPNLDVQL